MSTLQVSCEDGEEYKRNYRLQLKAMAETEGRAGVAPELLFLYLRPASVDALARGSVKVLSLLGSLLAGSRESGGHWWQEKGDVGLRSPKEMETGRGCSSLEEAGPCLPAVHRCLTACGGT